MTLITDYPPRLLWALSEEAASAEQLTGPFELLARRVMIAETSPVGNADERSGSALIQQIHITRDTFICGVHRGAVVPDRLTFDLLADKH
ncbi:MAG TPA: hypothetical protein VM781_01360 [Candidatus Bathyarchaeia archaeon]|nr:hypothetical protein [Candidatus Bathyarchaeia archaeon]